MYIFSISFEFKGQLIITKCRFGVFKSTKNQQKFFRMFALASKKRSIQKKAPD